MGIQINGNTNNINAGIGSLSIEDLNELDIVGVATASNFKTGSSNLHSTGLTVGNALVHSTGVNVGTGATVHCPATNVLTFGTNSNERLRIDSSGRVMIGTATQGDGLADNLTIADTGNCGLTIRAGSSSLSSIFFADGTGANGYIGQQVYNHGDNSLKWIVNGSERLRITSDGTVQYRTGGGKGYEFGASGSSASAAANVFAPASYTIAFGTNGNERLRINSNGAIGLGGATYGSSGQVLTSAGSGSIPTWTTISGTTINNNANDRIITGSGTANTLEGESTVTFNGSQFRINAGSGCSLQVDGLESYIQVAGVRLWNGENARAHCMGVGANTLSSSSLSGDDITAVGHNAYANGTSGEDNTVVGSHAMDAVVTGNHNCAFGHASLSTLTSGYNNSCYGRTSGFALLNGHNNTFLGYDAGYNTTSGSYNIFAGSGAGKYETTSTDNVAIGWNCFGGERSGGNSNQFNKNVCIGHQALAQQRISNGDGENVCIGYRAMYNTTTSSWRTVVIGFEAGYNNNGGSYNTFVGTFAGKNYTSGGNTMCLGYNAGTANSPSGSLTNQQDVICLGNNVTSQLYCNDTSISSSDARDKTDITEWTHGLSFINQLKPVTYRWDKRTWYGTDEEPMGTPDGSKKRARLHLGFLAQDALEVEKSFGYASKKDDMLAVNLNEDGSAYGMKYERLVVPLTKAVQELSAEVDKLKAEIAALKS